MEEVRLINAHSLVERVRRHISVAGKDTIVRMILEEATCDPWVSVNEPPTEGFGDAK